MSDDGDDEKIIRMNVRGMAFARAAVLATIAAVSVAGCTTTAPTDPTDLSTSTGPLESLTNSAGVSPSTAGATRLAGDLAGRELYPAALSPDGTRIAAVVETLAGRVVTPIAGYGTGSAITRFGPTELWVWDARSGARLVAAPIPRPKAMVFTPDGSRVITDDPHDRGAVLRAWDITSGRLVAQYTQPGEGNPDGTDGGGPDGATPSTRSMFAVSPDGSQIATYRGNSFAVPPGDADDGLPRKVRLWDAGASRIERTLESITATRIDFPPALAYTPDGEKIVAGFTSPRPGAKSALTTFAGIATWSASSGKRLESIDVDKRSSTEISTVVDVVPRDDGAVAIGQTGQPATGPGGPEPVGTLWIYDTAKHRQTPLIRATGSGYGSFTAAVNSDATQIAVLATRTVFTTGDQAPYRRQTLTTFDATVPRRTHDISLPNPGQCATDLSTPQTTVEYSPDGKTFMIADCGLALYDSADPTTRRTLQTSADAQRCNLGTTAQYSGDGTRVIGSGPCGIRLYDTATGKVVAATG